MTLVLIFPSCRSADRSILFFFHLWDSVDMGDSMFLLMSIDPWLIFLQLFSLLAGVLIAAITLVTEMCERSPDVLDHFKRVWTEISNNSMLWAYELWEGKTGVCSDRWILYEGVCGFTIGIWPTETQSADCYSTLYKTNNRKEFWACFTMRILQLTVVVVQT